MALALALGRQIYGDGQPASQSRDLMIYAGFLLGKGILGIGSDQIESVAVGFGSQEMW